jgi:hypothetical protein
MLSIENGAYLFDPPRLDPKKTKNLGNPVSYAECLHAGDKSICREINRRGATELRRNFIKSPSHYSVSLTSITLIVSLENF